LVDITKETRNRGDELRPDITIHKEIWGNFKLKYPDKNIRDNVISELFKKQLERELVIVRFNIF